MTAASALGVLRRDGFRRLWLADALSPIGSGVAGVAVSLTAVLTLGASPVEMGTLRAAATTPALLLSLLVGVWVDRLPRRPILVACELGRAALLLLIPAAALTGALRIELLIAVALLVGILTVIFDVAATSYVPATVARDELVEANAKLSMASSAHRIGVPSTSGWLVQSIGAPLAVVLDAAMHLVSGLLIAGIRDDEAAQARPVGRGIWAEITEGWRAFWDDRTLRLLILATMVGAFGGGMRGAIYLLYVVGELGIGPIVLGLILGVGGVASLVGALAAQAAGRRWSLGTILVASDLVIVFSSALVPISNVRSDAAVGILLLAQVLSGVSMTVFSINQISLRQAIVPARLLGRVNATRRVLVFGTQPVAAIVGGVLGATIGLVPTLVAAVVVEVAALFVLLPLRAQR